MSQTTDIVLRLIMQGGPQLQQGINQASTGVQHLGTASTDAAGNVNDLNDNLNDTSRSGGSASQGLNEAAEGAEHLEGEAEGAATATNGLKDTLERVRNAGAVLTGVGAAGLVLTQQMIEAHKEGDGLNVKLESILEAQGRLQDLDGINNAVGDVTTEGHFDDDDSIRDAAIHLASFSVESEHIGELLPRVARQVRTGFGDMTSVADGLGKAYSGLDLAPLARSGLVFTDAEKAALDLAKGLGEVEGRAKFVEIVTQAIDRNTVSLGNSITDAEAAANDLANAMDGAMTTMGAGAGDAQTSVNHVLAAIVNVTNEAPSLQYAAGYLGYFGSFAATAVGGLLTVGSQIGMTTIALQGMGITSVSSFTAMGASAWAAATGIWAAMAPLIPMILAIAAAALVATAAIYVLSGAQQAIDQAEKDEAQAQEADHEFYDKQVQRRQNGQSSRVNEGETFEQWQKRLGRGDENAGTDDGASGPADVSGIKAQIEQLKGGDFRAPSASAMPSPSMPTMTPASIGAPVATPKSAPASSNGGGFTESDIAVALSAKARGESANGKGVLSGFAEQARTGGRTIATTSGKGTKGEKAGESATREISVGLDGEANHEGNELVIHLYPQDIRIPYSGLGNVKGKVKRG